jgi:magnesium transporter
MDEILFLTELLGLMVYDLRNRRLGQVRDALLIPMIDGSRVDRFLISGGWSWLNVRYDQVKKISIHGIWLSDEQLTPYHSNEHALRLVRDLLDQQIIDAQGRKVVRVTDITFRHHVEQGRDVLRVSEVDIGLRSVMRRLVQGVIRPEWTRKLQSPIRPHSIRWEHCNVLEADPQRRLRLNLSNRLIKEMHPADAAEIVESLGPDERTALIGSVDVETAAGIISEIEPEISASILKSLKPQDAADIVEEMEPDEAADLLAELEDSASEEILDEMEAADKEDVEELLEFDEDTAGGMMTSTFVSGLGSLTVAEVAQLVRENADIVESQGVVFLEGVGGELAAVLPVARMFGAAADAPVLPLADTKHVRTRVETKDEAVFLLFDKYNLQALPVVDISGAQVGVITADDVITALRIRQR